MNYKETYNQGYENGYKDAKSNLLGREGKIVDCDFKNICRDRDSELCKTCRHNKSYYEAASTCCSSWRYYPRYPSYNDSYTFTVE